MKPSRALAGARLLVDNYNIALTFSATNLGSGTTVIDAGYDGEESISWTVHEDLAQEYIYTFYVYYTCFEFYCSFNNKKS